MRIRVELPADHTGVRHLHLSSFPRPSEADLVDRLRADGDAVISLVALEDEAVVGHVMFSKMAAPFPALGLAPVAVQPQWRRKGIAARLIEEGIAQAKADGWTGIFVLGEPQYYQRFGFNAAMAERFQSPYAGPYFMALPLTGDTLPSTSGPVDYAPAFSMLGDGEPAALG